MLANNLKVHWALHKVLIHCQNTQENQVLSLIDVSSPSVHVNTLNCTTIARLSLGLHQLGEQNRLLRASGILLGI